jgi:hypothetical protein
MALGSQAGLPHANKAAAGISGFATDPLIGQIKREILTGEKSFFWQWWGWNRGQALYD